MGGKHKQAQRVKNNARVSDASFTKRYGLLSYFSLRAVDVVLNYLVLPLIHSLGFHPLKIQQVHRIQLDLFSERLLSMMPTLILMLSFNWC